MTVVLGVDPGLTTGLTLIEVHAESGKTTILESHQLQVRETMLWLRRELSDGGIDIIGCERYIITTRTAKLSRQTASLEIIGCVKANVLYALTDTGIEARLVMQTPADAKSVWGDSRLKKHELWAPGHSKDALRHALLASERAGLSIQR